MNKEVYKICWNCLNGHKCVGNKVMCFVDEEEKEEGGSCENWEYEC